MIVGGGGGQISTCLPGPLRDHSIVMSKMYMFIYSACIYHNFTPILIYFSTLQYLIPF